MKDVATSWQNFDNLNPNQESRSFPYLNEFYGAPVRGNETVLHAHDEDSAHGHSHSGTDMSYGEANHFGHGHSHDVIHH